MFNRKAKRIKELEEQLRQAERKARWDEAVITALPRTAAPVLARRVAELEKELKATKVKLRRAERVTSYQSMELCREREEHERQKLLYCRDDIATLSRNDGYGW